MRKYAEEGKYTLDVFNQNVADNLIFYPPVKGRVTQTFNPERQIFGIRITPSRQSPVAAVLDGTVIATYFSAEGGICHRNSTQQQLHIDIPLQRPAAEIGRAESCRGRKHRHIGQPHRREDTPLCRVSALASGRSSQPVGIYPLLTVHAYMGTKRQLAILGSTGSIGTQALQVVAEHADLFEIYALTAHRNVDLLIEQARRFSPEAAVIADESLYPKLKEALRDKPIKTYAGSEAIAQIVEAQPIDMVLTAMMGYAGLYPTIRAIKAGKAIALPTRRLSLDAGELLPAWL